MSYMPRTMRGVRQLRLAVLVLIGLGAIVLYEAIKAKDSLILALVPYTFASQWLLNRFDRRFIDGFTRRR